MIDLEFMKRAEEFAKPMWDDERIYRNKYNEKWREENKDKFKKSLKKYGNTDKGKLARKRTSYIRRKRYKNSYSDLTRIDLENIKNFYTNCPKGYEVDHIIPICKGGKHELSNLQYLTIAENRRKGGKINWIHWKDLPSLTNKEYVVSVICREI